VCVCVCEQKCCVLDFFLESLCILRLVFKGVDALPSQLTQLGCHLGCFFSNFRRDYSCRRDISSLLGPLEAKGHNIGSDCAQKERLIGHDMGNELEGRSCDNLGQIIKFVKDKAYRINKKV